MGRIRESILVEARCILFPFELTFMVLHDESGWSTDKSVTRLRMANLPICAIHSEELRNELQVRRRGRRKRDKQWQWWPGLRTFQWRNDWVKSRRKVKIKNRVQGRTGLLRNVLIFGHKRNDKIDALFMYIVCDFDVLRLRQTC